MTQSWSNDEIFKFIELYQAEPVIWDPKHEHHKDRTKIRDAWKRIANYLQVPVVELKKKKETLMSAFRVHYKRKQDSIRSGEAEVYKPIWVYYYAMEAFLKDVYEFKSNVSMEGDSSSEQETPSSEQSEHKPKISQQNIIYRRGKPKEVSSFKRRRPVQPSGFVKIEEKIATAFNKINHALSNQKNDDDCELYGQLIAHKLRKFPSQERFEIMYEMDGLLLRRTLNYRNRYEEPTQSIVNGRPTSETSSYVMEPEFLEEN